MKKFALACILFTSLSISAQDAPQKCTAFRPQVLGQYLVTKQTADNLASSAYGQNGTNTNKYWDAYSDRAANPLYASPNTSSPTGKSLKFNEKVRIATIKGEFAQVFVENKPGAQDYPNISDDITVKGWVPMKNLLLWNSCPTNENNIYRKALIMHNIDMTVNAELGYISDHPDPAKATSSQEISPSMKFHYIMKEEKHSSGTRYLLAATSQMDGYSTAVLEGWVTENTFTPWNQRSCLEPTWNEDDVNYFKNKGIRAGVFVGKQYSEELFRDTMFRVNYGAENKIKQYSTRFRMDPYALRYPLLDHERSSETKTFKITAFGSPNGDLETPDMSIGNRPDDGRRAREEYLKAKSQYNIIVVIDGTRSMKEYFSTVADAIRQANDYFKTNENVNVKVGAVIYRDYTDGAENVIEYQSMVSPADVSIENFLKNIGRNNYGASSSSSDKTMTEAMYLGIKTALDHEKMGYSPKNANMVFIVGDCGNNPSDNKIKEEELLELCIKSQVQLFSFQVLNKNEPAFNEFNVQLTRLFNKYIRYLYEGTPVRWVAKGDGVGIRSQLGNFYASEIQRGQAGEQLSTSKLDTLIRGAFRNFRNAVDEQKRLLIKPMASTKNASNALNEVVLRRILGKDYDIVAMANSMLGFSAYTRMSNEDGRQFWKPVVLLSSDELKDLIDKLRPLQQAAKTSVYDDAARQKYVRAISAIIQSMTGMSADRIDKLSTDQVTRIIGGLNVSTPMLRGDQNDKVYTLSDIKNPSACPDDEFKRMLNQISVKISDLMRLSEGGSFKYVFEENGQKSYWLPLEMIP